jgi:hypothetical protein
MSTRACYRYRTPVLLGPWRRRPEAALEDAARAGQRDDFASWTVPGDVEQSLCDGGGPCGGAYPPPD